MNQPQKIVQLTPIGEDADARLRHQHQAIPLWQGANTNLPTTVQVLVTSVRRGCSAEDMKKWPQLKAICSWGAGYDTIDLNAAASLGIQVSNTPNVLDECVADMAWGLILSVARRIPEGDRYVRQGHWQELGQFPLGRSVAGKRLGLLGLGRIGQAIAQRAIGFRMAVGYHNRRQLPDSKYQFFAELNDLAQWADYLVVACTGGPQTKHLVNKSVLCSLGANGIIINISRGSVIDQPALIHALQHAHIAGAGLDVLANEPGAPEALQALDNVVLTPHMASATHETRNLMQERVIHNVEHFLTYGQVLDRVN
ncbi:2-hydroxyacid dehydrogenase [Lampropedia puyangensis]|uniref:2-hydroxyacid dehydrogenase n=1 Tax=Lampropedia puyangensis TaxID=1330072 RepID=A0A4S8FDY6_9BURK|nr:2-hydroxyacid dehydrogenase [Lampropedia puyangensis]THU05487.1 2-hydroxyacid dehydrogenase [Lampropedia puyangensis]